MIPFSIWVVGDYWSRKSAMDERVKIYSRQINVNKFALENIMNVTGK